ncbi:unnamed protein product, partial [Heterosigma akashiwo]
LLLAQRHWKVGSPSVLHGLDINSVAVWHTQTSVYFAWGPSPASPYVGSGRTTHEIEESAVLCLWGTFLWQEVDTPL